MVWKKTLLRSTAVLLGLGPAGVTATEPGLAADAVQAIQNVRVITGTGQVLEGVNVVIRDGLIESVGSESIPAGAWVIAGEGLTVHAGFIDAFSNLGVVIPEQTAGLGNAGETPEFSRASSSATREANRNGITPEFRARDHLGPIKSESKALRLQGFTSVLCAPPAGYLKGQSCVLQLTDRPPRSALLAEPGWLHATLGRTRGRRGGGYPGTLMAVLAHVRQALLDARHLQSWQEVYREQRSGVPRPPNDTALETLIAALEGQFPIAFEANSENDILRCLNLAANWGLQPIVIGASEGHKVADRLREEALGVIVALDFPDEPERKGAKKKKKKKDEKPDAGEPDDSPPQAGPSQDAGPDKSADEAEDEAEEPIEYEIEDPVLAEPLKIFEERHQRWRDQVENLSRLLDAGVRVSLTTKGASSPKAFVGKLQMLAEDGMEESKLLELLTTAPAAMLGIDHMVGTVQAGMVADLVVVEGDLGSKDRAVRFVFVDGIRFDAPVKKDKKDDEESSDEDDPGADTPTVDLTGKWSLTGTRPDGDSAEMTLELEQEGTTVTGTLSSPMGEVDVTIGSVEEDRFELTFKVDFGGQSFEFSLTGTAEGDSMTATFESSFGEPFSLTGSRIEKREEQDR